MDAKDVKELATSTAQQAKEVAAVVSPVIKEWAKELLKWAQEGKDFVAEQAPLICREIITWGVVDHLIWLTVGLVFLGIGIAFHKTALQYLNADRAERTERIKRSLYSDVVPSESTVFMCIFTVLAYVLSAMFVIANLEGAASIYFAPRLYLIEYLSRLVK